MRAGWGRSHRAKGQHGPAFLDAFDDLLAAEFFGIAPFFVAYALELGLVACSLERAVKRRPGVIGHVHYLQVVVLPAGFPGQERGNTGDANEEGVAAGRFAARQQCMARTAAEVPLL